MPDNFRKVTQRPGILCRVQVSVAQCSLIVLSPPTRWKCAFSLGRFGQNANIWSIMLAKIRMLSFRAKICLWSFSVSKNIKTHSHFFHPEFLHTPNWRWARLSQCKSFVSKVLTEILIWVFFSVYSVHIVFLSFVFLLMFFKLRDRYTQNTRVGEWRQIFWARRGKQASASAPPSRAQKSALTDTAITFSWRLIYRRCNLPRIRYSFDIEG